MDPKLEANLEWQKALRGELYLAFHPELVAMRDRCLRACNRFNDNRDTSRRKMVELWRDITCNPLPPPPPQPTQALDDALFVSDPWIIPPLRADNGINIRVGEGAFINYNSSFVDTCPITIGARTLVGPNCNFFSGTHPLDPFLRNGIKGPELGKPITIGEDCWIGGNSTILPGVTVGRGSTVGAGSVVTKDVPPFHVVAGNPARILRKIDIPEGAEEARDAGNARLKAKDVEGAEVPMAEST